MEERQRSPDDMPASRPISRTGAGFVIRVADESRKYQDWELVGPTGAWLMGGSAQESHEAALEAAYRPRAAVYPGASVEVGRPAISLPEVCDGSGGSRGC
jgi:hypothetical protein